MCSSILTVLWCVCSHRRTIIFSHNAVVAERDGQLCFMFKIGNVRISQLSDARVKLIMIKSRRTSEGEFIPFQSYDMKVGHAFSVRSDGIFFPWPKTVEHVIDENSPLYDICQQVMTPPPAASATNDDDDDDDANKHEACDELEAASGAAKRLLDDSWDMYHREHQKHHRRQQQQPHTHRAINNEDYEIVVMLEGNIETTGASCHIRTSYLPQEILFGYRFVPVYPMFTNFEYYFDYSKVRILY